MGSPETSGFWWGLGQSPIVPSFLKGGEKMAKRENVLEKLIGQFLFDKAAEPAAPAAQ